MMFFIIVSDLASCTGNACMIIVLRFCPHGPRSLLHVRRRLYAAFVLDRCIPHPAYPFCTLGRPATGLEVDLYGDECGEWPFPNGREALYVGNSSVFRLPSQSLPDGGRVHAVAPFGTFDTGAK